MRRTARTVLARLFAEPRRFSFDAAVRVLGFARRTGEPGEAARFGAASGLAFPAAEVTRVEPGEPPLVTVALMGLTGPSGVLPRHYTEAVVSGMRSRSLSLRDFLDVISHGMVALFARAGTKYRPHRAADLAVLRGVKGSDVGGALLALTGYAGPGLAERLAPGADALQHYSGLFSARPRSADRLASLASDWVGRPVEVEQFAGAWLVLPPEQRSCLARGLQLGRFSQLSLDAAVGVRAWDPQARIVLRIGPLDLVSFEALLPNRAGLRRLVGLVRAFVGYEVGFAINPVLARGAVPALGLGVGARLGWNSWMPGEGGARAGDAADAVFEAEIVEGLAA